MKCLFVSDSLSVLVIAVGLLNKIHIAVKFVTFFIRTALSGTQEDYDDKGGTSSPKRIIGDEKFVTCLCAVG